MRSNPQSQTLIGVLRNEINALRKANGWSRESVAVMVVEAHERIGAHLSTGITFDAGKDAYSRAKVNGEKISRWLDDETKDCTLLPANMLPTMLEVLPLDRRLVVLNTLLNPLGVDARPAEVIEPDDFDSRSHLGAVAKESTEAVIALGQLNPNASPAEIETVVRECIEAENAARRAVRGARALLNKAKSSLRRAA